MNDHNYAFHVCSSLLKKLREKHPRISSAPSSTERRSAKSAVKTMSEALNTRRERFNKQLIFLFIDACASVDCVGTTQWLAEILFEQIPTRGDAIELLRSLIRPVARDISGMLPPLNPTGLDAHLNSLTRCPWLEVKALSNRGYGLSVGFFSWRDHSILYSGTAYDKHNRPAGFWTSFKLSPDISRLLYIYRGSSHAGRSNRGYDGLGSINVRVVGMQLEPCDGYIADVNSGRFDITRIKMCSLVEGLQILKVPVKKSGALSDNISWAGIDALIHKVDPSKVKMLYNHLPSF